MDPASPEQPKPQESATQEEIIVPKEIIRPFARGLSQMFAEPIKTVREQTPDPSLEAAEQLKKQIINIGANLTKITELLDKLQHSKTVTLIPEVGGGRFIFSEETEEETPQAEEVIIDEDLTPKLISAISDKIGNPLAIVVGGSEIVEYLSSSEVVKTQMQKVHKASSRMAVAFDPIQRAGYQIKILTDAQGNTTITPIPRPTPQP